MTQHIRWEWIAGFFEGEGHVYWQEGRKGTKQGMGGRLIIGQKDKRPLQAIYDFLVAEGFDPPQFYLRPASKSVARATPCWMLSVCVRKDVVRMIEAMLPWLFQKTDKALMVRDRLVAAITERERLRVLALQLKKEGASWEVVRARLGLGRRAVVAYSRLVGVDVSPAPGFVDEVAWRRGRISRGLCSTCGLSRGENGTRWKCRRCADTYNRWRNEHRRRYGRKDRRAA